jgi:peroxiredoxin
MVRSLRRFVALSLGTALLLASGRVAVTGDSPVEQAVLAAEQDASKEAAARTAVQEAMGADAKAALPWVLEARLDFAAGKRAKGDERAKLFASALSHLEQAAARDPRDVEAFRVKAAVLVETRAGKDALNEALRAAAIRGAGEPLTRGAYERATGDVATLRVGDPMPLLVWKDGKGADVKAEDLWAKGPVVIELYRSAVWCGYCRKQLFALEDVQPKLAAEGATVVAISPDTSETIAGIEKDGLKERKKFALRLLSDPEGNQADRIGARNPDTIRKDTPKDAYGLPFPSTIIVDAAGIVRFVKTHGDFRDRVKPEDLLVEVRRLRAKATDPK